MSQNFRFKSVFWRKIIFICIFSKHIQYIDAEISITKMATQTEGGLPVFIPIIDHRNDVFKVFNLTFK